MDPLDRASKTWTGDWRRRIRERCAALGFHQVSEFMRAFAGVPYADLVRELGDDVAPVQLECVHFDEAKTRRQIREAGEDSLVRDLKRFLTTGWEGGVQGNFATVQAHVAWLRRLDGSSRNLPKNQELHEIGKRVWESLEMARPLIGWIPETVEDTHIQQAFSVGWPE